MVKADIYLQKGLWYATNEFCGEVTENYDKNYILPLVFVKQLSKRYEVVRDELKEQVNDPNSNNYTTDTVEINY